MTQSNLLREVMKPDLSDASISWSSIGTLADSGIRVEVRNTSDATTILGGFADLLVFNDAVKTPSLQDAQLGRATDSRSPVHEHRA